MIDMILFHLINNLHIKVMMKPLFHNFKVVKTIFVTYDYCLKFAYYQAVSKCLFCTVLICTVLYCNVPGKISTITSGAQWKYQN